jgi:ribosomal protein L13E
MSNNLEAKNKQRDIKFMLCTNLPINDAISAGYSIADARRAGYSLADAISAGYSLADARRAGYSLADAISAGYSLADARRAGYSLADAISAGYSLADAISAGYSIADARRAGYSLADAISAGYSIADARRAGYSIADARRAGYSNEDIKEWESIPILEKPYTTLLTEINENKRNYKQSTFGDINTFEQAKNICNSPMCIAGHLVNMAGKVGYDLRKKYDWFNAATLIHFKAHPDQPVFNFNLTDNSIGMAYLEVMAERENKIKPQ